MKNLKKNLNKHIKLKVLASIKSKFYIHFVLVRLWKSHRKVLVPVFSNKIVEQYLNIISTQANVLVDRLSEQSGKSEFDILQYITGCTLDIMFGKLIPTYWDL